MVDDLKIGIVGCSGRMGQMVINQVAGTEGCVIAGASEQPGHDAIGQEAVAGVTVRDDPAAMMADVDVVVDFTIPDATVHHAELAAASGTAMVIGTTGLDDAQAQVLSAAATKIPVVWAPNMSVGVTLLLALTEQVAGLLEPQNYDIEVVEMHHRHKIDAPSGTALSLGESVAGALGIGLPSCARWPHGRPSRWSDRLCDTAWRGCRRGSFGCVRRRRRTGGIDP